MKLEAIKDGIGNIIISEDSFEMLLACLDNQKFVGEVPQNGDSLAEGEESYNSTQKEIQDAIDNYNRECRKILHQKYIINIESDGYYLTKRFEHQDELTPWSSEDVYKVSELFKDTIIVEEEITDLLPLDGTEAIRKGSNPIGKTEDGWIVSEQKPRPWLIERSMRCEYEYLTISEDGHNNRRWKQEEIEQIKYLFI